MVASSSPENKQRFVTENKDDRRPFKRDERWSNGSGCRQEQAQTHHVEERLQSLTPKSLSFCS